MSLRHAGPLTTRYPLPSPSQWAAASKPPLPSSPPPPHTRTHAIGTLGRRACQAPHKVCARHHSIDMMLPSLLGGRSMRHKQQQVYGSSCERCGPTRLCHLYVVGSGLLGYLPLLLDYLKLHVCCGKCTRKTMHNAKILRAKQSVHSIDGGGIGGYSNKNTRNTGRIFGKGVWNLHVCCMPCPHNNNILNRYV